MLCNALVFLLLNSLLHSSLLEFLVNHLSVHYVLSSSESRLE
jgi:hypothetical protein